MHCICHQFLSQPTTFFFASQLFLYFCDIVWCNSPKINYSISGTQNPMNISSHEQNTHFTWKSSVFIKFVENLLSNITRFEDQTQKGTQCQKCSNVPIWTFTPKTQSVLFPCLRHCLKQLNTFSHPRPNHQLSHQKYPHDACGCSFAFKFGFLSNPSLSLHIMYHTNTHTHMHTHNCVCVRGELQIVKTPAGKVLGTPGGTWERGYCRR